MSKSGFQELGNLSERIPGLINIARIAIVLPLLVMHAFGVYSNGTHIGMSFPPVEFYSWAALYSFLILLSVARPDWQWQTLDLPNASAVVDISMMMILVYIAGGVDSGFGILVLPFVATSCLLSYGHYPMLYAGYASMLFFFNLLLDGSIRLHPFDWDTQPLITTVLQIGRAHV